MAGDRARSALATTRFADVRWVAETGSTNDDVMALARAGAPEGVVMVADSQRAGRGRQGRAWTAPRGASLLVSVLLRPPAPMAPHTTMAVGVAMAEAVEAVAGVTFGLKWPNDLVWSEGGPAPDRKVAGILAEADFRAPMSTGGVAVVAGIGVNVNWPPALPPELAGRAIAINHVVGTTVDREDLLIEYLRRLDARYGELSAGPGPGGLLDEWRRRSATLGRAVRVELAASEVVGTAIALSDDGLLVVETAPGHTTTISAGDVTHVRPL